MRTLLFQNSARKIEIGIFLCLRKVGEYMNGMRYLAFMLCPFLLGGIILLFIRLDEVYFDRFPAAFLSIIVAFLLLLVWYHSGRIFAERIRYFRIAILLGNSIPILFTIIYLWQTVFMVYENANAFIGKLCHFYFAPLYVVLKMALLPISKDAVFTVEMPPFSVVAQVLFLLLELWIFIKGYLSVRPYCNRKKRYFR